MSLGEKMRGMLCGVLIGCALLCLFFSVFAAAGCAVLAWLSYPPRRKRSGAIAAMFAIIALLLIALGVVLAVTDSGAEPAPAKEAAPTETVEVTAAPATVNPLDTGLAIYPADVSVLLAIYAQPLTADVLDGSAVQEPGSVFYVDGEVLISANNEFARGLVLDSEIGSVTLIVGRIAYDGERLILSQDDADSLPTHGTAGRFFLTYQAAPDSDEGEPILLYGADDLTVAAIQAYAANTQSSQSAPEPTATPEPTSTITPAPQDVHESDGAAAAEPMNTYVCNVKSMVFHRPSCSAVDSMASYNKQTETCYASTLIAMGYTPCSKCNPS